jgi:hypothetical protein
MAIGTGDFTAKQKKGFAWKFGVGILGKRLNLN